MRQTKGIIIVSALLILVFVAIMGLSAMFLTNMNLRIAENTRTQSVARNNGETGLDTALVVLAREFKNNDGAFPTTESAFKAVFADTSDYTLKNYSYIAQDKVKVQMTGVGPRGAEYVSEANIKGVYTAITELGDLDPLFGVGFVSNGNISFPGNSNLELSVWSGETIDFTGGKSTLAPGFWARSAGDKCEVGRTDCQTKQAPPDVKAPNFSEKRLEMIVSTLERAGVDVEGIITLLELAGVEIDVNSALYIEALETALADLCDETLSGTVNRNSLHGKVLCLEPNTHLTLTGDVSDLTIIGDETTSVDLRANTGINAGVLQDRGIRLVSGTINLTDSYSVMNGANTIVAKEDIYLAKEVTSFDDTVRTFIMTDGDVILNGNGGRDIYATFWSGGQWRINGTIGDFIGTVVAYESSDGGAGITGNGGMELARLPANMELEDGEREEIKRLEDAGIKVLSRR